MPDRRRPARSARLLAGRPPAPKAVSEGMSTDDVGVEPVIDGRLLRPPGVRADRLGLDGRQRWQRGQRVDAAYHRVVQRVASPDCMTCWPAEERTKEMNCFASAWT